MKILLINDFIIMNGGAESFIFSIKEKLKDKGYQVDMLGSNIKENISSFYSRWYSYFWYNETKKKIKEFKPDIIHINNCSRILSPSPIKASLDSNIPIIMTLHDFHYYCPKTWAIYKDGMPCKYGFGFRCFISNCKTYKEGNKYFLFNWLKCLKVWLHRLILKNSKITFIAPTKILSQKIQESLNVKVKVIPNGIFLSNAMTNYEKTILFVGRISKEKGLQEVCDSLNTIKNYSVLVLGEGQLKNELESKYLNIRFLGFQIPEKYYRTASIAVVPSVWMENFSYSILEAMSYGLCVVASNIGGIPEQIKDMETGVIFDPGNKNSFKEKMDYLTQNPLEIKRMGKNAREFVRNNYDWNKIIKNYISVYETMTNSKLNTSDKDVENETYN